DALAQGAEGLGLMQNEDHQVLGNEQKLEEDASDCTRVDDDSVEFFPEERHKVCEGALDRSFNLTELLKMETIHTEGELTKVYEHSTQSIDELTEFKYGLMQQGVALDELKHDLSTEEFVAHKCKDAIVKNKLEIISLCEANIEPNKADPEEVADMDLNQLPTSASVVRVSSIILISIFGKGAIFPASKDLFDSEARTLGSVIPPSRNVVLLLKKTTAAKESTPKSPSKAGKSPKKE
nr:hypothetical protein [Tanacetum cinerariifolium]